MRVESGSPRSTMGIAWQRLLFKSEGQSVMCRTFPAPSKHRLIKPVGEGMLKESEPLWKGAPDTQG